MTRSEKNGSGYWSDEYKYGKNRNGSSRGSVNKVKRKKMRDVTSNFTQSGINSVDTMPTRTFTQRWGLATIYEADESVTRSQQVEEFKSLQVALDEKKETMKTEKLEEKFNEWSQGKSKKVVRKALKKSQRDGLEHPFEEEETDSEIEKEYVKEKSKLVGKHPEVVKYLETGSTKCFKREREFFVK